MFEFDAGHAGYYHQYVLLVFIIKTSEQMSEIKGCQLLALYIFDCLLFGKIRHWLSLEP